MCSRELRQKKLSYSHVSDFAKTLMCNVWLVTLEYVGIVLRHSTHSIEQMLLDICRETVNLKVDERVRDRKTFHIFFQAKGLSQFDEFETGNL